MTVISDKQFSQENIGESDNVKILNVDWARSDLQYYILLAWYLFIYKSILIKE